MKDYQTSEKNQVVELSKEEMQQTLGGRATAFAVEEQVSRLSEEVRCVCGNTVIFMGGPGK